MAWPFVTASGDGNAQAAFVSAAQASGLPVQSLTALAQLQLAVANLLTGDPAIITGDITATSLTIAGTSSGFASSGALTATTGMFAGSGLSTTPSVLIGTAGAGGGGANSIVLNYEANASSRSWRIGNDALVFGDFVIQQSTTREGTTYVDVLNINPTGGVTLSSALGVTGATTLGASAGTAGVIIDGTAFGAGVASLRLNGLTTAATANLVGTLTNSPVTGNPTFWMPISIAGTIKYVPCF